MTSILRRPASLFAARLPERAAASRAMLAAATIVGLGGAALALPAVQSKAVATVPGLYQETLSACSTGLPTCAINFSKVPANKQLIVTNATCYINASASTTGFLYVVLGMWNVNGSTSPLPPLSYLKPTLTGTKSYARYYHADGQILHLYDGGETPRIWAYPVGGSGTKVALTCTIAGKLQKRPAP
jgi:hypothetical protein